MVILFWSGQGIANLKKLASAPPAYRLSCFFTSAIIKDFASPFVCFRQKAKDLGLSPDIYEYQRVV
jgi:hypothetical protein